MVWKALWLFVSLACSINFLESREEKIHFVIDICSFNNQDWCIQNLESVFSQRYRNFHVYYTDDCSTDDTAERVKEFVKSRNMEHKVIFLQNKERRRQMANHYRVAQMCKPNDVIVVLDGDDCFAHRLLLYRLSRVYEDDFFWMTYGQFKNWPTNQRGYCRRTPANIILSNSYRKYRWFWGHLRTYRAWLAQLVKLEDLIVSDLKSTFELAHVPGRVVTPRIINEMEPYKGKFFPASADLAFGHPMIEMAGFHMKFLPSILYIRNVANSLNTFKTQEAVQQYCARYIRAKHPYKKLVKPIKSQRYINNIKEVDIVLFYSEDGTEKCTAFLEAVNQNLENVGNIIIIYDGGSIGFQRVGELSRAYHNVNCIDAGTANVADELKALSNNHILVCKEPYLFSSPIKLAYCAQMLEKTYAYGFYFDMDSRYEEFPHEWTGFKNIWFWQFRLGNSKVKPQSLSCVLYNKQKFMEIFKNGYKQGVSGLINTYDEVAIPGKSIGLFLKQNVS